jgi:hypothetical protein
MADTEKIAVLRRYGKNFEILELSNPRLLRKSQIRKSQTEDVILAVIAVLSVTAAAVCVGLLVYSLIVMARKVSLIMKGLSLPYNLHMFYRVGQSIWFATLRRP